MSWLASKALMGLCGLGLMLVAAGLATWTGPGAMLVVIGGGVLGLWAVLNVRAARGSRRQPGRGLVPAWVADRRLPRTRRVGLAAAYVAAIGLLAGLAAWWPTVGGVAGVAGLLGMFALVAVLDLVVRPLVLGAAPAEPGAKPGPAARPGSRGP